MNQFDYKFFYRRNLPHIQPLGATFFITFRLAGSLPQVLLRQWEEEKRLHLVEQLRITDEHKREQHEREWQRRWFRKFESSLDRAQSGPTWLKDERVAAQVAESLRYRDGKVYRFDAYCIMSNHVHVVFAPFVTKNDDSSQSSQTNRKPLGLSSRRRIETKASVSEANSLRYKKSLASIMQSLKGYTAWKANRLLGRSGEFWAHESYDHYVRDEKEWERTIVYTLNNPVKAGLTQNWQEWQWSYYRYAMLYIQRKLIYFSF